MKNSAQNGTFLDHLEELRKRIILVLIWFSLACILSYVFNKHILKYIVNPLQNLQKNPVFISPVEPFLSVIKIVLFSGLLLSYPFILYQTYVFVKPALTRQQGKMLGLCLFIGVILFYSGICLSHLAIVPAGLKILFGFGAGIMEPMITINQYLSFIIWMNLILGLIFQIPVVMFFMGISRIIEIDWLKKMRRIAYVVIFVIAALITPTIDGFTMLIVSGIMILLYEITLILMRFTLKRNALKK
ncbi:MAG: twin-arginine translocase subunit TatC [Candidatus Omnitrophica bacterium]|nr:twin-arginine translocase subunit TatC [Candidatus Omnitrophota bacterium]MCM8828030.1 twin-arginine translocase subunit TatC [Candidatus Omnitrophota bacterium]